MATRCRICDSSSLGEVSIGSAKLTKCADCGVHFLSEFPQQSSIDDYYRSDYKITSADMIETEFRKAFRAPEQIELINIVSKYMPAPAKLLDIGCDKAFFIEEAQNHGFDCTGVELSETAKRYASERGIELISDLDNVDEKHDLAVMWHSLEHIPDPNSFLQEIKEHLAPNSYLFIRVPAFDSIWRKLTGKYWIWLQPENHFFHYSKNSLKYLLENNGFEIELLEHRKPNNEATKRSYRSSLKLFKKEHGYQPSLRSKLIRKYEDLTGVELFAVAKWK